MDRGYTYVVPAQSNPISGTDVRYWLSAGNEADRKKGFMKAYPKFDDQIFKMITLKLKSLKEYINEEIKLNVKVGDEILMGKFKNKKVIVKNIGKDEYGMPTINGKKAVTFRIPKKDIKEGLGGGAGVGLSLAGGYINGAPNPKDVKKLKSKLDGGGSEEYTKVEEDNKLKGGKADGMTLKDIAKHHNVDVQTIKTEFIKGYAIEREHTSDPNVAKEIALDHLYEHPSYYTRLAVVDEANINETTGNGAFYNDGNTTTGTMWNGTWEDYDNESYYLDNLEGWDTFHETPSEFEKKRAVDQKLPVDDQTDGKTHKYNRILKTGLKKPADFLKEELILEGGAYGHMAHPFDIEMGLTFGDLKQIVVRALNGDLELAREKTDGQALAVSSVS